MSFSFLKIEDFLFFISCSFMWQFPPLMNSAFLCVWRRGMVYLGAKAWVVSDESLCHVAGMEILLHIKSENLNVGFILESPGKL